MSCIRLKEVLAHRDHESLGTLNDLALGLAISTFENVDQLLVEILGHHLKNLNLRVENDLLDAESSAILQHWARDCQTLVEDTENALDLLCLLFKAFKL